MAGQDIMGRYGRNSEVIVNIPGNVAARRGPFYANGVPTNSEFNIAPGPPVDVDEIRKSILATMKEARLIGDDNRDTRSAAVADE